MLRFEGCDVDELLLEGNSMPLESIRSCELAVECWNLRATLAEADQAFVYTKRDLKVQQYTLRKVQQEMHLLRRSLGEKDKIARLLSEEVVALKSQVENLNASRSGVINGISRTEHSRKVAVAKQLRLEVENATIKSQLAAQEQIWQDKFTAMERLLTMDIIDTEKERVDLRAALAQKGDILLKCQEDNLALKDIANQISQNDQKQKNTISSLEDKCAWGAELEQAYESLHGMLELAEAEKHSALQRVRLLEEERIRVYDYVINEGVQLPSSLCADDV